MKIFGAAVLSLILASCNKSSVAQKENTTPFFIRGLDLSFTPEMEENLVKYYDGNTAKPLLQLVKDKGINTVRIRIWNKPSNIYSSLAEVTALAQRVKQAGLKFWLDFHYSDYWADPGKQNKPASWAAANFQQLQDSVYVYTKSTMAYLIANNATPDYVQVGNEINNGILWDDGKIYTTPAGNWTNFTALLKRGVQAVRDAGKDCKIIIHFAGYDGADYFYQHVAAASLDYDIIGLSYYPWWHGKSFDGLQAVIKTLETTYKKPVMIAETAYPFTMQWDDNTNNIFGAADMLYPGYEATAEGQALFTKKLMAVEHSNTYKNHAGICWWAPEWIAFKGNTATDGSPWENLCLFDFSNKALPALEAIGKD